MPPDLAYDQATLSPMAQSFWADNRRVRNDRIKRDLRVVLAYPTYREGLAALAAGSEEKMNRQGIKTPRRFVALSGAHGRNL